MTRILLPFLAFAVAFAVAAFRSHNEPIPISNSVASQPGGPTRSAASDASTPAVTHNSPEKQRPTMEKILALPTGRAELELAVRLGDMPASEIAQLWQHLTSDPGTLPSMDILRVLATAWAAKDPAAALSAVLASGLDAGIRASLSTEILRRWSMDDPQAALAAVSSMPPGVENRQVLLAVAYSGWATSDPDAAFDAVLQLPSQDRVGVISTAVWFLAGQDPEWLLTRIAALPPSDDRNLLVATSLQAVARMADPETTIRWLKEKPGLLTGDVAQSWKAYLLSAAGNRLEGGQIQAAWDTYAEPSEATVPVQLALIGAEARKNPEAAFERLAALGKAEDVKMRAAAIQGWASQDPASAADYVYRTTGGAAPAEVLAAVVDNWADDDPYSTANWLSSLPAGSGKNKAAAHFVEIAWQADPENVLPWASLISDESWRNNVTRSMLRAWSSLDRSAATRWAQSPNGSIYPADVTDVLRPKK
jgi:hypothetical protein